MNTLFAETLRKLRKEKGLSQSQLASQMFVNKSTIARWENGTRLPDAAMITRLSKILEVDVGTLLSSAVEGDKSLNIIMVDDNKAILSYSLLILEEVVPNAAIVGFNWPQEAIEYAKANRIDLAVLDIEMVMVINLRFNTSMLPQEHRSRKRPFGEGARDLRKFPAVPYLASIFLPLARARRYRM